MTRLLLLPLIVGCLSRDPTISSTATWTNPANDPWNTATWPTSTTDTGVCQGGFDIRSDADYALLTDCVEIAGTVDIWGPAVTTLAPLENVEVIGGSLRVSGTGFVRIDGLDGIRQLGSLDISHNDSLIDIGGINGVVTVEHDLYILSNPVLLEVDGLGTVESVDGAFSISGNGALTAITGFGSLGVVGEAVVSNAALQDTSGLSGLTQVTASASLSKLNDYSIEGFSALQSVGGDLELSWNLTTRLGGLRSLQSVNGDLTVDYNEWLVNVDGLAALRTIGGALVLEQNPLLNDISGLDGLESIGDVLLVIDNPELCESEADDLGLALDVGVIALRNKSCL